MIDNLNVGSEVSVVERDEWGEACEATKYLFVTKIHDYVLCSPYVVRWGRELDIDELLKHYSLQTVEQETADIYVFPSEDCYETLEEAKEALKSEVGDDV